MNTELVIFDLDGTLLNTIADLGVACNYALAQFGYPLHAAEEYPLLVGNGVSKLIERALPEGEKSAENVERLRRVFIPFYNQHCYDQSAPYAGIPELLTALQQQGVKLAVASNKYQAGTQALVQHFFPQIAFAAVLGQREGIPVKPNPQIVFDILRQAQVTDTARCRYVGDSAVDMRTAHNAGIASIAVTWGFRSREELQNERPTYMVDKPQQILDFV